METNLLLVGAGAIGCELLKNYAMLGLSTGEKGKIFMLIDTGGYTLDITINEIIDEIENILTQSGKIIADI